MTRTDTADEASDGMVCSEDGVVVRIRPREARDAVPAYEYVVRSDRHGPVAVQIRQSVPEDVEEGDLGFPSACEDHWTLDGSDLVARLQVEPDDQVQTVWGVRGGDHPSIDPPTIEVSPVDRDADDAASEDSTGGTLDLDDPSESSGAFDDGSTGPEGGSGFGSVTDGGTGAGASASPAIGSETVVAQLLQELESGTVEEAQRSALADALELQASDSANAFVDHVQDKVDRRTDRLEDELQSIEESVDQLYGVKADASELSSIKHGITELDDTKVGTGELRDVRTDLEEVRSTIGALAKQVEHTPDASELEAIAERLDEVADETAALQAELEDLEDRHENLAQSHDELAADVATHDEVDGVREAHRGRVNSLSSNVSDLRETVEEEYVPASRISTEIDRRIQYGAASFVLFGIGAVGLVAAVALGTQGSSLAAATFAGGAVAMLLWLRLLRSDDPAEALPSLSDLR